MLRLPFHELLPRLGRRERHARTHVLTSRSRGVSTAQLIGAVIAAGGTGYLATQASRIELALPIGDLLVAVPLAALLGGVYLYHAVQRRSSYELRVFIAAYLIRVIAGYALAILHVAQDELLIHEKAVDFACCDYFAYTPTEGYTYFLGTMYRFFGESIFLPKAVNAFLGALAALVAFDVAMRITRNNRAARRTAALVAFLPPLVIVSSQNLKETSVALLLLVAIRTTVNERISTHNRLLQGLAVTGVTYLLRGAWALFPLGVVITGMFWPGSPSHAERPNAALVSSKRRQALFAAVVLGLLLAVGPLSSMVSNIQSHIENRLFIGAYAEFGTLKETSSTSVTRTLLDVEDPWSVRNVVVQLARTPFIPSPLQALTGSGFSAMASFLLGASMYILWPLSISMLTSARRLQRFLPVVVPAVLLLLSAAFSLMLHLTVERHLIAVVPLLAVTAAAGLDKPKHSWPVILWGFGAVAFNVLYFATRL